MSKAHLLQIIFVILELVAFILLTIQAFGDMNPDVIKIAALVMGVGLVGSSACAIARVYLNYRDKSK